MSNSSVAQIIGCVRSKTIEAPPLVHAVAWSLFAVFFLAALCIFFLWRNVDVWQGLQPGNDFYHSHYAETIHAHSIFRTRANTWSNLAYILAGCYAIGFALLDRRNRCRRDAGYLVHTPAMSILFGLACIYLGIASGFFHASLTRLGQQFDVASMYMPLLALIALNLGRWRPRLSGMPTWPIWSAFAIAGGVLFFIYKWSLSSSHDLPALILVLIFFIASDRFQQTNQEEVRWMIMGLVALFVAVLCRQLDVAGHFTGGDAWLQGHALWHVFTALSLACAYLYYRSETVVGQA